MSFKSYLFGSLSIATAVLGLPNIAAAENIYTVRSDNGIVYQVDLDDRLESTTDSVTSGITWRKMTAYA